MALTNARSTTTNKPATARPTGKLQPQTSRIAKNINTDVSSMVSDTAIPKAAARLSDDRKPKVRPSVRIISVQLTKPI